MEIVCNEALRAAVGHDQNVSSPAFLAFTMTAHAVLVACCYHSCEARCTKRQPVVANRHLVVDWEHSHQA
jgi:hypothetical protein